MTYHPQHPAHDSNPGQSPAPPQDTPDFILYDDFSDNTHRAEVFIPDRFIITFCHQGSMAVTVNQRQRVTLGSGDMLVSPPKTTLEDFTASDDMRPYVLSLAPSVISDCLVADKALWESVEFIAQHPKIHLTEEERELFKHYYLIYKSYAKSGPTKFRDNILRMLHKSIVYEMADMVDSRMDNHSVDGSFSQTDNTFSRFLHLLADTNGRERSVAYFSSKLCITTKYLSAIVKQKTGRSAKQIIDDAVADEIRRQLNYTSKTVKEIANDLGFPSLSFFGTYTRKHLKASPANIRKEYMARKKPLSDFPQGESERG